MSIVLKNELKTHHYIYKITNLINGKIYVGRRSTHLSIEEDPYFGSGGKYYQNALKKYGIENFSKEILEICDSFDSLCFREEFWIMNLKSYKREVGYNATTSSNGFMCGAKHPFFGKVYTEEEKEVLRKLS